LAAASAFSTVSFEAPLRIIDQMLAGWPAFSVGSPPSAPK
jgi:hypothetical protein